MSASPQFGWVAPEDSEMVRAGAAAIRSLANSIDLSFRGGRLAQNTDGNGTVTVANHGLGRMPKLAGVSMENSGIAALDGPAMAKISVLNASGLIITIWRAGTDQVIASNGVIVWWWIMG